MAAILRAIMSASLSANPSSVDIGFDGSIAACIGCDVLKNCCLGLSVASLSLRHTGGCELTGWDTGAI